jgi:hypothetical protein
MLLGLALLGLASLAQNIFRPIDSERKFLAQTHPANRIFPARFYFLKLTDTDAPATTTTTTTTTPRPRSHTVGVRGQEHENLVRGALQFAGVRATTGKFVLQHQRFRWRDPPPSTTTQATTTILPWPSNGLPGHRHNMVREISSFWESCDLMTW